MSQARRYLLVAFIVACLAWCAWRLRTDLASISFASLSHAIPAVALATALSLFNYTLRIVRWRMYLSRLGHEHRMAFDSFAYLAGFAFTLSPGKVGELMRARYYVPRGMPADEFGAVSFVERLMDVSGARKESVCICSAPSRHPLRSMSFKRSASMQSP